jgi:hypothetical protein
MYPPDSPTGSDDFRQFWLPLILFPPPSLPLLCLLLPLPMNPEPVDRSLKVLEFAVY